MKPVGQVRGPYIVADDDPRWSHDPESVVEAAMRAGGSVVQLRLKHQTDQDALGLTRRLAARTRASGTLLIVNDRYDLADLGGAQGVHLGQEDLPPERIPLPIQERLVVGLSTHTLEQVKESRDRPVDYVAFGPVFGTRSKETGYTARGLEALAEAVRIAERPVVAIGGITSENVAEVRRAGAIAFAVVSAVANARDPERAVTDLAKRFGEPGA
jgi:thiamine-phosphate pyrophosphorylase